MIKINLGSDNKYIWSVKTPFYLNLKSSGFNIAWMYNATKFIISIKNVNVSIPYYNPINYPVNITSFN